MQKTLTAVRNHTLPYAQTTLQVILGSVFLALVAQVAVRLPFSPIPITLHTLGVALLILTLGKKAPLAIAAYMFQATMGLPVLSGGGVNPLWIVFPTGGYIVGFLISSFCVAKLIEAVQPKTLLKTWMVLATNEVIIFICGGLWLACLVGWENTLAMGVLPFLPGAFIKTSLATIASRPIDWIKNQS